MRSFGGIYPALVCPMRPAGGIDEPALARLTERLVAVPGIKGVMCNGHAGENHLLERAEKRRVVAIVREAAGRSVVVAGVNDESSARAALEARDAEAAGADAVLVFAPYSWALGQDREMAVTHHRHVAEATSLPLMLFQGSVAAGALAYPPEVLERLVRLPRVVAIKEGSWETAAYEANLQLVRRVAPEVAVMASGDEHLFPCFVQGSDGSMVSLATLIPEPIVALDAAVRAGDLETARAMHARIQPLARVIYGMAPGCHATSRLKAALAMTGAIPDETARAPAGRLEPAEREALERVLQDVGPCRGPGPACLPRHNPRRGEQP